jgi:hypothetical protein
MQAPVFTTPNKLCAAGIFVVAGLTLWPFWLNSYQAHKRALPVKVSEKAAATVTLLPHVTKTNADNGDDTRASCEVPSYLQGILPPVVHGLAISDVAGPAAQGQEGGVRAKRVQYKLVAFSHWPEPQALGPSQSQIMLISVRPEESATLLWQSAEDEYYEPKIISQPDWQYQGHQVYLIARQAGAAAVDLQPVWIAGEAVKLLPSLYSEHFEIKEAPGNKHELVGYWREGGQNLDQAHVFDWNGRRFAL